LQTVDREERARDPRAGSMPAFARETLTFATRMLGADWATMHLFDADLEYIWLASQGIPLEFRSAYLALGMPEVDPLNVPRKRGCARGLVTLDELAPQCARDQIERYRSFLRSFNVADAAEMVFVDEGGQVIGGISLIWTGSCGQTFATRAREAENIHRYIEVNYRMAWRYTPVARKRQIMSKLGLTRREAEVVALLCDGLTNTQIAASLRTSLSTVKCHLTHAFEKAGVPNRTGMVRSVLECTLPK
jgi:DNA-binding CsgD family transcriptional regulator